VTTDNAQPAVITAAEFVSGGYAQRVAAGECVVMDATKCIVMRVSTDENGDDDHILISYTDGLETYWWAYERDAKFTVHWLPATDELASLRAQVARYRAALKAIIQLDYGDTVQIARAALAETEEA